MLQMVTLNWLYTVFWLECFLKTYTCLSWHQTESENSGSLILLLCLEKCFQIKRTCDPTPCPPDQSCLCRAIPALKCEINCASGFATMSSAVSTGETKRQKWILSFLVTPTQKHSPKALLLLKTPHATWRVIVFESPLLLTWSVLEVC